jgi:hypothetical protein
MDYSEFKLSTLIKQFDLSINENLNLFTDITDLEYSEHLKFCLTENVALAVDINTEKARSELIIAPVLLEVRRQMNYQISLFSGTEFNVAPDQGLNGACDFLLSLSQSQLIITAPVVVEAKKDDLISRLGRCIATMVAAQKFNLQKQPQIQTIYRVVTSGTAWRFIKLTQNNAFIDVVEYYVNNVGNILGILFSLIAQFLPQEYINNGIQ